MISYAELYLYTLIVTVILGTVLVLGLPFSFYGIQLRLHRMTKGPNAALAQFVNRAGNLGLPKMIDLSKDTIVVKKKGIKSDYPITKDMLQEGRLYGFPYVILDVDDAKTSLGIYYHQTDDKGEPLYYTAEGKNIGPVLKTIKPSTTLSPSFLNVLVGDKALTQALKELFDKHRTLILILGGLGVLIAFNTYILYEFNSNHLQVLMNTLKSMNDKLALIAESLK